MSHVTGFPEADHGGGLNVLTSVHQIGGSKEEGMDWLAVILGAG